MKSTRTRFAAVVAVAATSMATLGAIAPAQAADVQPDPTFTPTAADFVGVGSDTSQLALHYLGEGVNGVPGFNQGKSTKRLASWAATPVNSQITVVGGTTAITRPNGSGAGKAKLYGGTNDANIDFARSSSNPSQAEATAGLQQFPFAVDGLKLAVATNSNAPATITDAQLVGIYKGEIKNWSEIGGTAGVIKPLVPQSNSGTRIFFEGQLQARNGGTAVPLAGIGEMQEHDPALIQNDPNAVAPFSTGRAKSVSTIKLTGGFAANRALYNVVRGPDATTPDVLGVFGSAGFVCSDAARPLVEAAGFQQLARPAAGGVCGQATQVTTTNFKVAGDNTSTTTLTASALPNGTATLRATLSPATAEGTVEFFEGDTKVAGPVDVDTVGTATATVTGLATGSQHSYRAVFTPSNAEFSDSVSAVVDVTVPAKFDEAIRTTVPTGAYGATRTVTVAVDKAGVQATGPVSFVYGSAASQSKALVNGRATFTVPATTAAGVYWGVASYHGDGNFERQFQLVKFTVAKATTKTTLKLTSARVKVKAANKATVTVAINGSTIKANGTVKLTIGSTTVGTGKVVNGKATVTVKGQATAGSKSVKATFTSSSANYGSSASAVAKYTVVK